MSKGHGRAVTPVQESSGLVVIVSVKVEHVVERETLIESEGDRSLLGTILAKNVVG